MSALSGAPSDELRFLRSFNLVHIAHDKFKVCQGQPDELEELRKISAKCQEVISSCKPFFPPKGSLPQADANYELILAHTYLVKNTGEFQKIVQSRMQALRVAGSAAAASAPRLERRAAPLPPSPKSTPAVAPQQPAAATPHSSPKPTREESPAPAATFLPSPLPPLTRSTPPPPVVASQPPVKMKVVIPPREAAPESGSGDEDFFPELTRYLSFPANSQPTSTPPAPGPEWRFYPTSNPQWRDATPENLAESRERELQTAQQMQEAGKAQQDTVAFARKAQQDTVAFAKEAQQDAQKTYGSDRSRFKQELEGLKQQLQQEEARFIDAVRRTELPKEFLEQRAAQERSEQRAKQERSDGELVLLIVEQEKRQQEALRGDRQSYHKQPTISRAQSSFPQEGPVIMPKRTIEAPHRQPPTITRATHLPRTGGNNPVISRAPSYLPQGHSEPGRRERLESYEYKHQEGRSSSNPSNG